jgi:hypothetical protein
MSLKRRLAARMALIIALIALGAILGQFALNGSKPGLGPWLPRAWDLAQYFTILTNALTAYMLLRAVRGPAPGPDLTATVVLNISMVGLVYQILLAPAVPLQGANWWTDLGLHTVVPLATLLWWLAFGNKGQRLARIPIWLIWPGSYCLYALVRGHFTGRYPYFFLDVARFGPVQIALNIAGLVVTFAIGAALLWLIARPLRRLIR